MSDIFSNNIVSSIDTSSIINTSNSASILYILERFLIFMKISAIERSSIPSPIKECIVCPPIIKAAVPVVAVKPIFLPLAWSISIICLIV